MESVQVSMKRKSRSVSSFLSKTYEILSNDLHFDVVRWASNGIGFVIMNQQTFAKEVLPQYFKHSNYSSFVRQLNMYSFHKIRQNNSESYFHHQSFVKNKRYLLNQIKRKRQRKDRKIKKGNEESELQLADRDDEENEQRLEKKVRKLKIFDRNGKYRNFQSTGHNLKSLRESIEAKSSIIDRKSEQYNRIESIQLSIQQSNQKIKLQRTSSKNIEYLQRQEVSIKNIANPELILNDDDKLSINNEICDLFPKYQQQEKQMFYPSNNNIYLFPTNLKGSQIISQFNILF